MSASYRIIHLSRLLETLPTNLENCEKKGSIVTVKKEKKVKKKGLSDPNVIFSNDQCLEMKENSTFLLMKMVHIGYVFDWRCKTIWMFCDSFF